MDTYNITATYNGATILETIESPSSNIVYNDNIIIPSFVGDKVLNCSNKYATSDIFVGNKAILCDKKIIDYPIFIHSELALVPYTYTNIFNNSDLANGTTNWYLTSGVYGGGVATRELVDGDYCFHLPYTSTNPLVYQYSAYLKSPRPIENHLYYGGCMIKAPSGFTAQDMRFEWFYRDYSTLIFGYFHDTANQWSLMSSIGSMSSVYTASYEFRFFTLKQSLVSENDLYVKKTIFI